METYNYPVINHPTQIFAYKPALMGPQLNEIVLNKYLIVPVNSVFNI